LEEPAGSRSATRTAPRARTATSQEFPPEGGRVRSDWPARRPPNQDSRRGISCAAPPLGQRGIEPWTRGFQLWHRDTRPVPTAQILSLRHLRDSLLSRVVGSSLVFGHSSSQVCPRTSPSYRKAPAVKKPSCEGTSFQVPEIAASLGRTGWLERRVRKWVGRHPPLPTRGSTHEGGSCSISIKAIGAVVNG
jgi:hypothetical protein